MERPFFSSVGFFAFPVGLLDDVNVGGAFAALSTTNSTEVRRTKQLRRLRNNININVGMMPPGA